MFDEFLCTLDLDDDEHDELYEFARVYDSRNALILPGRVCMRFVVFRSCSGPCVGF